MPKSGSAIPNEAPYLKRRKVSHWPETLNEKISERATIAKSLAKTSSLGLMSTLIVLLASAGCVKALLKMLSPSTRSIFFSAKRRLSHRYKTETIKVTANIPHLTERSVQKRSEERRVGKECTFLW